jgi:hypothetical protein
MASKIEKRIVGYAVKKAEPQAQTAPESQPLVMNETIARPDFLLGSTYKIKPPISDHALYITINDIVLNEGTDHEVRRPYEVFINSKEMDHFQWVIALTRVISAVFRKGGDVTFLVEELRSVYDPNGGYYKKGGVFMPSLVAEIGAIVEKHMKSIGLIEQEGLTEAQQQALAEKRAQFEAREAGNASNDESGYPPGANLCKKCHTKAVIIMDGCATCLSCGDSKCG